jgi:phosphoribosylformylglycinamidine (FGAM) synthase PurS component
MRNPTGKKLEKLIFGIFDDASQGVDRYNHNDSLWLIFTNEMRWVVEYTKDQTLWYNYNFFKEEMELIGLDCVEDKDLIKKWFESRFLGIPKVEDAFDPFFDQDQYVEDAIKNGVKDTRRTTISQDQYVEDTIQNGVKDIRRTRLINLSANQMVEDTIQNGVKHTMEESLLTPTSVEDTIQNGVKHTKSTIMSQDSNVEDTIQNGVKETTPSGYLGSIEMKGKVVHQIESPKQNNEVEDTIQNGVRHTEDGDWLDGDERFEDIIQEGVKETNQDCSDNIARVEGIIRIGEKIS